MSERMTDAEFEGRVIGAMSLVERDLLLLPEARRARAEEARQAEVIRELADALAAQGCMRLVGLPQEEWHTEQCWTETDTGKRPCIDECKTSRTALRKAGRLP